MGKKKILALITAALLAVTSAGVLANSTEEGNDWWQDINERHGPFHGDNFEEHHQAMHGADWEKHVAGCHSDTDGEDMHTDGHMGTGRMTMM